MVPAEPADGVADGVADAVALQTLGLQQNQLPALQTLWLQQHQLAALQTLWLQQNQLTALQTLWLQQNQLTALQTALQTLWRCRRWGPFPHQSLRRYPRRLACESQGSHAEMCHGGDAQAAGRPRRRAHTDERSVAARVYLCRLARESQGSRAETLPWHRCAVGPASPRAPG